MDSIGELRKLACRLDRVCRSGAQFGWRQCRRGLASVLDLVFPPVCVVCAGDMRDATTAPLLCDSCQTGLGQRPDAVCPRCVAVLPPGVWDAAQCPECRRRDFVFDRAWAVGEYRAALRDVVLRTKRSGQEHLAFQMGRLLAQSLEENAWGRWGDLIVPVPSHWWRRWTRGMNGPEMMGEAIGGRWRIKLATRVIRCRRRTRKQGTLLPDERQRNVRGAFEVTNPAAVRGREILLIDDVMTTGATVNEASRVLLKAGAATVRVAVVARGGNAP